MQHLRLLRILILVFDIAIVNLGFLLSSMIYFGQRRGLFYFKDNTTTIFSLSIVYIIFFYLYDLYYLSKEYRTFKETTKLFLCVIATMIGSTFLSFFFDVLRTGRAILVWQSIFVFFAVLVSRNVISMGYTRGYLTKKALIIGSGHIAEKIYCLLKDKAQAHINVSGIITDGPVLKTIHEHDNPPILGTVNWSGNTISVLGNTLNMKDVIKKYNPDLLILALQHDVPKDFNADLLNFRLSGIDIITMQTLYENIMQEVPFKDIDLHWLIDVCIHQEKFSTIRFKRAFDITFSLLLLIALSPPLLIGMLLIKLTAFKAPVFYKQERLGKNGIPFHIIKLRTMIPDAEKKTGPVWVIKKDPRVTLLGKIFRKTRIDEIPQLFNILKGDMSLVGPRPEREIFINDFLKIIPFYYLRLAVQPGLTGWAQIKYPYAASLEETEDKFRCDLYYIKNMSTMLDFNILWRTVRTMVTGKGL